MILYSIAMVTTSIGMVLLCREVHKYRQIADDLYKDVERAEQSRDIWYNYFRASAKENEELQQKLAKFDRPRCPKTGRFKPLDKPQVKQ